MLHHHPCCSAVTGLPQICTCGALYWSLPQAPDPPDDIPTGISVTLQSENRMLGMGPFPIEGEAGAELINDGKQTRFEVAL